MSVYGTWWGGMNYSVPSIDGDVEIFDSIEAAAEECERRYEVGHMYRLDTFYLDRDNRPTYFPSVSDDSSMMIYLSDPRGRLVSYPDFTLSYDVDTETFIPEQD